MSKSKPIYQVSTLLSEMRSLMELSYPEIWIEGELSSLSKPASGHLYFSLKDEQSQLRCAMFRNRASLSSFKPNVGDLVRVRAKISVYTARGDLQCIVQHIEEAGEGLLQRRYEELKSKLNNAGLFDASHKKTLPNFAQRIGIITSPTGAAIKDILTTLERRCPGIPITIYPAVVQGETAARSIIQAIHNACQHQQCDVLILTRGGGSLEDLWCFNDETLAYEIHKCPIPLISGVGHEVDVTIADLVADQRAPTPTAAAEILSPDTSILINQLRSLSLRLSNNLQRLLQQRGQNVDNCFRHLVHPKQQLIRKREALQRCNQALERILQSQLERRYTKTTQIKRRFCMQTPHKNFYSLQTKYQSLGERLLLAQRRNILSSKQSFHTFSKTLHAVSPLATLDRGFAITRNENQDIIRDATSVSNKEKVTVQLKSGSLLCTVNSINIENKH